MTAAAQTKRRSSNLSETPRLNLGAGDNWLDDWVNVDLNGDSEHVDLGVFPWPYPDCCVDEIMASHILEHFPKEQARQFLAECFRVLRPHGKLYVAVPDMDIFINCKLSGDWTAIGSYHWKDFNWMFGGNEGETRLEQRHRYMYNVETLTAMLEQAGFEPPDRRGPLPEDNPLYHGISLYMTGEKWY